MGSKVSVNRMMTMDSVKSRMTGDGQFITYLEFSYMLLQAYDFAHLGRTRGCSVQLGGQDQWGNIVMGTELGRKLHDLDLAGLTMPLVTKADGAKFGKSESGNVWLDKERTPVFAFFQFWRNVDDADVGRFLRFFTFLPVAEIAELEQASGAGDQRGEGAVGVRGHEARSRRGGRGGGAGRGGTRLRRGRRRRRCAAAREPRPRLAGRRHRAPEARGVREEQRRGAGG